MEFDEELEVASLNGVVTKLKGEMMIHAHGTFSNVEMKLIGGHVKEIAVGSTLEVSLIKLEGSLTREFNEEIGFF